jgi:DNA-binding MarR family transcriptional regulator
MRVEAEAPVRGAARKGDGRKARPAELGTLGSLIGFNLRLAQDASFRVFARHSGEEHLKPGRFAALTVIHDNPGIAPSALGRAIGRDKSTVTPLIQDLERHALVVRGIAPDDRRRVALRLTRAGEAALKSLGRHARDHDRKLDRIVGDGKAEFVALLKKIAAEIA